MVQRSGHIKGFSTRRHKKNTSIKRIEIALPAGRRLMLHHP